MAKVSFLCVCITLATAAACSRSTLPPIDTISDDGDPIVGGDPQTEDMPTGDSDGDADTVVLPGIAPEATGYLAYDDPVLGRHVTDDDLIERTGDISASDVTTERCVYRGPIHINGSGVTLRACLIEVSTTQDATAPAIYINGDNVTLSYLTIRRLDAATQGAGIDMAQPNNLEIDHVRIEVALTGINAQGNGTRIHDSVLLGMTMTGINTTRGDNHIYTNNAIEVLTASGTAGIRLGSGDIDALDITDSRIDGGEKHIVITSAPPVFTNARVLRNIMNGHTSPIYDAANSTAGVIIVHLPTEQAATPASVQWPIEGDDASHWHGTTDLSPSREGDAIIP